jgi:hypothetical protein
MRSLSQALSDEHRALLALKTMWRYGLVKMVRVSRQVRPVTEAGRRQIVA